MMYYKIKIDAELTKITFTNYKKQKSTRQILVNII